MATLTFRDSMRFCEEAVTVTASAALAGLAAPLATDLPVEVAGPAAALLGGSVGAALTRPKPAGRLARATIGLIGGALAAVGFTALATQFGLGEAGSMLGGALGGLALGSLLASDEKDQTRGHTLAGMVSASALGAMGAVAAARVAAYGAAESAPVMFTSGMVAGLMGLWISAGSGARRLEVYKDPLVRRAEDMLESLRDPVKTRVNDGLDAYQEVMFVVENDASFGPSMTEEARDNARALFAGLLDTAGGYQQIHHDLGSPRLRGIEQKLADLSLRTKSCEDPITLGHLARAQQALRAQKAALDGLRVGQQRAEAAIDAQVALLDRLRLAVAQYQATDRERFALELSAVADQAARLTDDLDSLSAAISEAESFSDRRILADVERAGRRALATLDEEAPAEDEDEIDAERQAELERLDRELLAEPAEVRTFR